MRALSVRRALAPLSFVLLAAALAAPAQAQLGGFIRRATEKRVEQKAEDRMGEASLIEPTFDATTVEITAERLDRYVAAMQQKKANRAQERAAYEAVQQRITALNDSARAANNDRDRNTFESSTHRYGECRSEVNRALEDEQERKSQELIMKMQSNPVAAQNDPMVKKVRAAMEEVAAAQAKGDAAAQQAALDKVAALMGGPRDSASLDRAAVSRCGARPAKPASMVRSEAYSAKAAELEKSARQTSGESFSVNGSAVNMSAAAAHMMGERIASFLAGMRADAPITKTFSKDEYNLLVSRRGDLRKAWSGS